MRRIIGCMLPLMLLMSWTLTAAEPSAVFRMGFEAFEPGGLSEAIIRRVEPRLDWASVQRVTIVADGANRYARVKYPKGALGPDEGGAIFKVKLPPAVERTLEFKVRFEDGFDFSKGGKLPGLAGGKGNTGGHKSTGDGWSARFVFRENGRGVLYLYHVDQKDNYGDQLPLGVNFTVGTWHDLKLRVRVNTPGKNDGQLECWVDGKPCLKRSDIRYRNVDGAMVDTFLFETFHGGATRDWAPARDCYSDLDEFVIW